MLDEVRTFKISKAAEWFLDLESLLSDAKSNYDTQKWIKDIRQPILILHAKEDRIVPYELGEYNELSIKSNYFLCPYIRLHSKLLIDPAAISDKSL